MRLEYIHNLRGVAILFILLAHSISVIPSSEDLKELRYLFANSSVLFVVIAGYLFAVIANNYTYKSYLINKVKNVLYPYVLVSFPAALIYILGFKATHAWLDMDNFNQLTLVVKYLFLLVTGAHLGPLWFIPMIVVFYFLYPIFRRALNTSKWLLILLTLVSLSLSMYIGRPENNENTIQSFFYFLPAYLWGIILFRVPTIIVSLKRYSLYFFVGFLVLLTGYYSFSAYNSNEDIIIKLVFSTLLYALFSRYLDQKNHTLGFFADVSFFLFFVHGYFTGAFRMALKSEPFLANNQLLVFIVFSLVLISSVLCFYIAKPIVGKYRRELLGVSLTR